MNKKIILNGIELSLPKYDTSAVTLFDYLDNVVTRLEEELGEDDGNFQMSINVDFSAVETPKHEIYANGTTPKKTKEKIAKVLRGTKVGKNHQVRGSVRVNLQVENR